MNEYLDLITRNHKLEEYSESSMSEPQNNFRKSIVTQNGGNTKDIQNILKHTSTGSFPPIYKMKKEEKEKELNDNKTRGVAQVKTALSIKEIMESRRDKPSKMFISL